MNKYGELIEPGTVRFERLLPGPVTRVWAYLTESEKRGKWFCGGATELEVGGRVELHFENANLSTIEDVPVPEKYKDLPAKMSFDGEVTACDPPRLLSHTWREPDSYSEVTYELREEGDKVRLVLTHRRLDSHDAVISVCGGWHTHLDILADVLEGIEPQPFWAQHGNLEADYEERIPATD